MTQPTVSITVKLTSEQAWQLAGFFERLTFADFRANARDDAEASTTQDAGERVRQALVNAGFTPR